MPPDVDKHTGNVMLLLEGVRGELRRAVFAHGCLSAFAMILLLNGTKAPWESAAGSSTDMFSCRPLGRCSPCLGSMSQHDPAGSALHLMERAGSC